MWYALLIPLVATIVGYRFWPHRITPLEIFVPTAVSAVVILVSQLLIKEGAMSDVEYNGHVVTRARYYEYWSTWVEQTCTRQVPCGTDSKGNTQYCTETYDCSYCDEHSPYWEVYTNDGRSFGISQDYYLKLVSQWSARQKFVDMGRSIERHGWFNKCGQDGNAYEICWDGKPETSEGAVTTRSFTNKLKVNHSAFSFQKMEKETADSLGLYDYPETYSHYKQKCILSRDFRFSETEHRKLEFINANLGPKNKVKVFTLIFKDKPIEVAFKQEQYWEGGNQNELVVCIGVDSKRNIQWVKPFSWCDNKRITVDTREDVAECKVLNVDSLCSIYNRNIPKYFRYKSFKDFDYLEFEPTSGQLWFVYILTLVVSVLSTWFVVTNEFDNETKGW